MLYVHYNQDNGMILGIYDDAKHKAIPNPKIEISSGMRDKITKNPGTYSVVNNLVIQNGGINAHLDNLAEVQYQKLKKSREYAARIEQGVELNGYSYKCTQNDQLNLLSSLFLDRSVKLWRQNIQSKEWEFADHTKEQRLALLDAFVSNREKLSAELQDDKDLIDLETQDRMDKKGDMLMDLYKGITDQFR